MKNANPGTKTIAVFEIKNSQKKPGISGMGFLSFGISNGKRLQVEKICFF